MTPDGDGIPVFDLDDLAMSSLADPVTAGQCLAAVNKFARAIYRVWFTSTHVRAAQIQSVDPGPPKSLTVQLTSNGSIVTGVRYQQGLAPVVGDFVFVLTEASFSYVTGKIA